MTEVVGVVITRFWAVAGSFCLEIRSCMVSLNFLKLEGLPKSLLLVKVGAPNDYRAPLWFAFSKIQNRGPIIGFKVGKSTIAIELKFRNVMTTFLEEEIYRSELAIRRSPFRFTELSFRTAFIVKKPFFN